jgi:hypothetical protein
MADGKNNGKNRGEIAGRAVLRERALAKPKGKRAEASPRLLLTAELQTKFNSPELMQRRATAIAEANAGHTKKSDNALESILMDFKKLSF